mmetsp:Transcript_90123/g.162540  ORF Transcript_90123/g.162540 Transcript_90123/m.162540 type:complete len:289 (+) Transcript_90123:94-960(+)
MIRCVHHPLMMRRTPPHLLICAHQQVLSHRCLWLIEVFHLDEHAESAILRINFQQLDLLSEVRIRIPLLRNGVAGVGALQEGAQELPQEVVVRLARVVLRTFEDCDKTAPELLPLHLLEAVACEVVGSPTPCILLACNRQRHGVDGPKVLIGIADDVQGCYFRVASIRACFPGGREVAILHAESRDDAPPDHRAVAPVIETCHRHGPFRLAHDVDTPNFGLQWQALQNPMHLTAPQAENVFVELLKSRRVLHHRLSGGVVCKLSFSGSLVEAQIIPVRRGLIWSDAAC